MTHNSSLVLFCGCEEGRSVVGDADCETRIVCKVCKSLDAREVKTQSRRPNLHSQASFRLRFSAQRATTRPGIGATIHFTGEAELFIQTKDSSHTIRHHIVLRKQLGRRRKDCDAQITERVEATVAAKLLADQNRTVRVRLVQTNAGCLI